MTDGNDGTEHSIDGQPADEPRLVHESTWSNDGEYAPVHAVVDAVAGVEGCNPTTLPPLFDSIDPESLTALFSSDPGTGADIVCFTYHGYAVELRQSTVRLRRS